MRDVTLLGDAGQAHGSPGRRGPGRLSTGPRLPRRFVVAAAGGGALAAVSLAKLLTARTPAPAPRTAGPAPATPAGDGQAQGAAAT